MIKIVATFILAIAMSLSASAVTCRASRFVTHPALLTHAYKGGKLVFKGAKKAGKATAKGAKATAHFGKKILF